MFQKAAVLATAFVGVCGLRKHKEGFEVAGVPLLNYRYRHLQPQVQGEEAGRHDWILKFQDGMGDEDLVAFCGGEAGQGVCKAVGHPSHGGAPLVTLRATVKALEHLIRRHPGQVEFIEPDSPVELEPEVVIEENDPTVVQSMWNLENINLKYASFTGKGVNIYVMDTGIRTTHADFAGRAVPTIDTILGDGAVKECDPADFSCAADSDGHGTHVAGTAGGASFGVARGAALLAMKVCCGSGTNILAGMDWVAQHAQRPAVMTMSLGSYTTPESSRVALDAVVQAGVTVTVSAGNRNSDSCKKSYTFIAAALGVGAVNVGNKRASFSNWGDCNAIFAPGVDIVSASHRSDTGSATMSGTSMAAPLVAGASALLLEENPSLTPAAVRSTLQARSAQNQITELRDRDPNMLLNVGDQLPPTPAPEPICPPEFSKGPDAAGDCGCLRGLLCYDNGNFRCPISSGSSSPYYFSSSCKTCVCMEEIATTAPPGSCPWHGCLLGCGGENCKYCERCQR